MVGLTGIKTLRGLDSRAQQGLFDSRIGESAGFLTRFSSAANAFGLNAPGSGPDDVRSARIATEQRRRDELGFFQSIPAFFISDERVGRPLTREEFDDSEFNIPGVDFREGDTDVSLELKARQARSDRAAAIIAGSRQGIIPGAATIAGSLAGSVVDVKNVTAGLATGGAGGLAVRGGASVLRASRSLDRAYNTLRSSRVGMAATGVVARVPGQSRTVAGVAGDLVASAPGILTGLNNEDFTGRDYGFEDALVDMGASIVFGRVFDQLIPSGLQRISSTLNREQRTDIAQLAQKQFEAGQEIDTGPLAEYAAADNMPGFTTVDPVKATPAIRQLDDGSFEAVFPDDGGIMRGTAGRGLTPEQAEANLRRVYADPELAALETGFPASVLAKLKAADDISRPVTSIQDMTVAELSEFRQAADRLGLDLKDFDADLRKRGEVADRLQKAEDSMVRTPEDPDAKKELRNAKRALARADKKIDAQLAGELSPVFETIRSDAVANNTQANRLRSEAKADQKQRLEARLQEYIKDQTLDPADPAARKLKADPDVRDYNPQEVEMQSRTAAPPGQEFGPEAIAEADRTVARLRQELEMENVPDGEKEVIREILKEIDDADQRVAVFEAITLCKGGVR